MSRGEQLLERGRIQEGCARKVMCVQADNAKGCGGIVKTQGDLL